MMQHLHPFVSLAVTDSTAENHHRIDDDAVDAVVGDAAGNASGAASAHGDAAFVHRSGAVVVIVDRLDIAAIIVDGIVVIVVFIIITTLAAVVVIVVVILFGGRRFIFRPRWRHHGFVFVNVICRFHAAGFDIVTFL